MRCSYRTENLFEVGQWHLEHCQFSNARKDNSEAVQRPPVEVYGDPTLVHQNDRLAERYRPEGPGRVCEDLANADESQDSVPEKHRESVDELVCDRCGQDIHRKRVTAND
jgi:hypothetical protein